MTKRLQITLLSVLAALLCVALVFGCVAAIPFARADDTATGGATETTVPADPSPADDVVVLDKIEDFRTVDNGDGTYTISGLKFNKGAADSDFKEYLITLEYDGESTEMMPMGDGSYIAKKCALSSVGMRKLLELPEDDNCGLVKGAGEGVSSDETDEQFAERVYNALYQQLLDGGAVNKKFKVVIPSTVSSIGDNAFLTYRWVISGSAQHYTGFVGGNEMLDLAATEYHLDFTADPSKSYDENYQAFIIKIYEDSYDANWDEATDDDKVESEFMAKLITAGMYGGGKMPNLAEVQFAKKEDGTRSLTFGQNVFGSVSLDKFTLPCDLDLGTAFNESSYAELEFEEGITAIPANIAKGNATLTKVVIPSTVTEIGSMAFSGCSSLGEVTLLCDTLTHVGASAFSNIFRESEAVVNIISLDKWLSYNFDGAASSPVELSTKGAKLRVKNDAGEWEWLKDIRIPASVDEIPDRAFTKVLFETIEFEGTIKRIGTEAFYKCFDLKSVNMQSVEELGNRAFALTGLTSVTIPNTLKVIPAEAFRYCPNLAEVKFADNSTVTTIGKSAFSGNDSYTPGNLLGNLIESITIPASVETIEDNAFDMAKNLKTVNFAEGSRLNYIGSWAFYRTSIKEMTLPSSVTTLKGRAFFECGHGYFDSEVDVTFTLTLTGKINEIAPYGSNDDKHLFNPEVRRMYGVVVKAADKEVYDSFAALYGDLAKDEVGKVDNQPTRITYPIAVNYMFNGASIVPQQNYWLGYGLPETLALPEAVDEWYADEEGTVAVTAETLLAALKGENSELIGADGNIALYAKSADGLFIARDNLVYDGKEYSGLDLNDLLTESSLKITEDMTVSITSYRDLEGVVPEVLPSAVKNAGIYELSVDFGSGSPVTFALRISRAVMDISAIDWQVSSIGGASQTENLISTRLYLYLDAQSTPVKTIASLVRLDMSLAENSRYSLYSIIDVVNSVARYRNDDTAVQIALNVSAFKDAFTVTYSGDTSANVFGAYSATATITPSGNYDLVVRDTSGFYSRGIALVANADNTFTVTKRWYVAGMANWLTDADKNTYTFGGKTVFGSAIAFTVPQIMYGDVNASQYGSTSDPLVMTLYFGDEKIGEFSRRDYARYINAAMPAGTYRLEITIGDVVFEGTTIVGGSARVFGFTVTPKALPETELAALNNLLKGKTYNFDYDNAMHLLTNEVKSAITALQTALTAALPARTDTVWADSKYDSMYGGVRVTFNLDRMHSGLYFTENDLNGETHKPVDPDRYIVYYMVKANNFASLVSEELSTSAYDAARREYVFNVVIVREIALPTVGSSIYNGNVQKADIASSEFYTVNAYDGFVNGGTHSITLTLVNSQFYRWAGKQLGEATVTVDFTIAKADNVFTVALNMLGWNYETFDAAVNNIRATARYLDDGQSIHFRVVKKGETTAVTGLTDFTIDANGKVNATVAQALNALKVGEYALYAKVNGTDNYNELERNVSFAVAKSINTWADGEDDLVLPSWIVGTFNPEENLIVVKAAHGEAVIEIRDMDGNVYYNSLKPEENTLNTLDVGKYLLVAWVAESEDYAALAERSFTIEVLEKIGLPWWGTTLIAVGALAVAAAIILILWKLKVFEILTDKISLAITTRATVDATIAAVRATKKAEEADAHKRKVEARERLEAAREANKNKTPEQRAEELAAKAEVTATKADKLHARASKMRERADKLAGKTEQNSDVTDNVTVNPDDTSTEE